MDFIALMHLKPLTLGQICASICFAGPGKAQRGTARQGEARRGRAWQGKARQGKVLSTTGDI